MTRSEAVALRLLLIAGRKRFYTLCIRLGGHLDNLTDTVAPEAQRTGTHFERWAMVRYHRRINMLNEALASQQSVFGPEDEDDAYIGQLPSQNGTTAQNASFNVATSE